MILKKIYYIDNELGGNTDFVKTIFEKQSYIECISIDNVINDTENAYNNFSIGEKIVFGSDKNTTAEYVFNALTNINSNIFVYSDNGFVLDYFYTLKRKNDNILIIAMYQNPISLLVKLNNNLSINEKKDILNQWLIYCNKLLYIYENYDNVLLLDCDKLYNNSRLVISLINRYINIDNINMEIHDNQNKIILSKFYDLILNLFNDEEVDILNCWHKLNKATKIANHEDHSFFDTINDLSYLQIALSNHTNIYQKNKKLLQYIFDLQTRINNNINNNIKLYGAYQRLQNQLGYQLGITIINSSKSFIGIILLPYHILSCIKQYKRRLPNIKKLPKLREYADYAEAQVKISKHLSYILGHNVLHAYKKPFGFFIIPYVILKSYREYKHKKGNK